MIKEAVEKAEGDRELVAVAEMKPQHFAIPEDHAAQSSILQAGQAQVAANEFTIQKPDLRKISIGQVTIPEDTFFKLSFFQRSFLIINFTECFIFYKDLLHHLINRAFEW